MSKRIATLILILIFSLSGMAKKMILPIELVAIQADIIVTGQIIAVNNDSYDFEISKYLKGIGVKVIKVKQFEQWTCDTRYAPVATGQKLILFLLAGRGIFTIINGSTGEIPILKNEVSLEMEQYNSRKFIPYKLSVTQFSEGIQKLIFCFDMQKRCNDCYPDNLLQKCSDAEITIFISTSKFTAWLYDKIKRQYKIKVIR